MDDQQQPRGGKLRDTFTRRTPLPIMIVALLFPLLVTFVYFVLLQGFPSRGQHAGYVLGKGLQFTFPAFWCLVVLREPRRWPVRGWAGAPAGAAFGLVIAAAMWPAFAWLLEPLGWFATAGGTVQQKMQGWNINSTPAFIGLSLFYALIHSLLEEYYWRWFVYRHLSYQLSEPTANLLSSLGFMAHHVLLLGVYFGWSSPLTYLFSAGVAIGGSCWAWLYHRSGSLLGPWISHMLIDAGIFVVGYFLVREMFV